MKKVTDKKQAIFSATLKLVAKFGFHGTSMAMIHKEAGVSAGTIYHYFESKDQLIVELYKEIKKKMAVHCNSQMETNTNLRSKIMFYSEKLMRYQFENPTESLFIDQFSKSPYYNESIENQIFEYFEDAFKLMEQAQNEQLVKDLPFHVFHAFSVEIASSLSQKAALGFIELDEELIQKVISSCWEAVKM